MILAGDIGGTKTVLALFEEAGGELREARLEVFQSREHPTFEEILVKFLAKKSPGLKAGCFGVAGPIIDGKCKTTNLPWELDEQLLAKTIQAPRAKLLNDLEAAAYGMLYLKPDELHVLNPGAQLARKGNVAVLAAGTGLGEAMLYWDGNAHHPIACEGGHTDFGPQSEIEIELLRYLRKKYTGHVSYERILSGPGFTNIYEFLRERGQSGSEPAEVVQLKGSDPNPVISKLGLANSNALCVETLELFCTIYGAEAGNLALKCLAVGGVYIGGGIAPKMLPALQKGSFMKGFTDKGRFAKLLQSMPVKVALNPRAPLLGAGHFALRIA